MRLLLAVVIALVALLMAASGAAAVTRGWMPPLNRHPVRRVRLPGWGRWVVAFALCWQVVFGLVIGDIGARQWRPRQWRPRQWGPRRAAGSCRPAFS